MGKLKLYVTTVCPYCQIPKRYIKDNDLDVEIVNISKDPKRKSELLDIGGKMQVPMLSIDGKALYESRDIVNWLKENI